MQDEIQQRQSWQRRVADRAEAIAAAHSETAGQRAYVQATSDLIADDHSEALADNASRDSAARILAQMNAARPAAVVAPQLNRMPDATRVGR